MAEADLASWFVARAVEAYGDRVLDRAGESDTAGPQAVGRELARLIFGRAETGASIPAPVAIEIDQTGNRHAGVALDAAIEELVEADPGLSATVAEVLAGYYRQQLESGDGQALVELGELLWFDEPEVASAAFERAVDVGNRRALIKLATHRRVVSGDHEGAMALYQQALTSPDPDIAAEALTQLGEAFRDHGDYQAARAAWEQCIATANPEWAPHAMAMLGGMLESRLGDHAGALAMLQAAFDSGHPDVAPRAMLWAGLFLERAGDDDGAQAAFQRSATAAPPGQRGTAMCELADVLKRRGDTTGATAIWRQVIDTEADEGSPEVAFTKLVNHLWDEGDVDGLRAAHRAGAAKSVREAPYALVVIGRVLRDHGELDGWREAWQQAIDAGFEDADDLRDELSPPAEDQDDDETIEVPAEFDPRNMARSGIAVLENGLPALPEELTHRMAVPMAYWTAGASAAVLFLQFHRDRRIWDPWATMATFTRHDGQWRADTHWLGTTFHDPFTDPGGLHSLGGEAIVYSGSSSGDGGTILHGIAAPAVKYLALIQDGHEDRRPLDNHFGAWIVRTDNPGPFQVTAIDENGSTLDEIQPTTSGLQPPLVRSRARLTRRRVARVFQPLTRDRAIAADAARSNRSSRTSERFCQER